MRGPTGAAKHSCECYSIVWEAEWCCKIDLKTRLLILPQRVMPFVGRCLINRDMVFIYNMRDNASFDKLLLDAMVEHGSENIPRTLKYAFELNTVEVRDRCFSYHMCAKV